MKTKENLQEFEELVLLAILKLGSAAYGAAIHEQLENAGRNVVIGALYTTLSRLEKKGYVSSWMGDATAERGGRAKKFFKVEASGQMALTCARNYRRHLSSDPELRVSRRRSLIYGRLDTTNCGATGNDCNPRVFDHGFLLAWCFNFSPVAGPSEILNLMR